MTESLNGDLSVRVSMDPQKMTWTPSPSGTVWRKRFHRVGPAESGQVTSLVRYEPNSRFPRHEHPDGEEILVLEGVFSDEHGDWHAGTYLLNPEGFSHAPFSKPGCELFVKLRQFPGRDRQHLVIDTNAVTERPGTAAGISVRPLYEQSGFSDTMRLERWTPGTRVDRNLPLGAEFFVVHGDLRTDTTLGAQGWLRLPAGSRFVAESTEGCVLYVKEGGFAYLRAE
jgi:anti-sigma factor ChrR (cupin superfamily)